MSTEVSPASRALRAEDASEIHMTLQSLTRVLGNVNYRYSSGVRLHESLANVLQDHGPPRGRAGMTRRGGTHGTTS